MTREQAQQSAAELNREHAERATHRWLARETPAGWSVVRVSLPAGMRIEPLRASVETRPRPPQAPDPRSTLVRNVGGPYGGT